MILSTPLLVSLGKDILEAFLAGSVEFYSKLPSVVESKLSFTVSDLVNNQVQFSSKTHCRKVGFFYQAFEQWDGRYWQFFLTASGEMFHCRL